jgi:hypothetical protein
MLFMTGTVGWARVDPEPDPAIQRAGSRRRTKRRVVGLVTAAVVVAGVGIGIAAAVERAEGHGRYDGLTLHYPHSWHAVDRQFTTAAAEYPLGYLTNQAPVAQCSGGDGGGQVSCHAPVIHLGSGGVLVTISARQTFGTPETWTTRVAGLPASVARGLSGGCPSGAISETTVMLQTRSEVLTIDACFGSNATQAHHDVNRLISTATYG